MRCIGCRVFLKPPSLETSISHKHLRCLKSETVATFSPAYHQIWLSSLSVNLGVFLCIISLGLNFVRQLQMELRLMPIKYMFFLLESVSNLENSKALEEEVPNGWEGKNKSPNNSKSWRAFQNTERDYRLDFIINIYHLTETVTHREAMRNIINLCKGTHILSSSAGFDVDIWKSTKCIIKYLVWEDLE